MLLNLQIKDFLLIEELELDFFNGLTVITGETGSGKSITIDALMLIFGAKANPEIIRSGQNQTSLSATFHINNSRVIAWLQANDFNDQDNPDTVICRRIIDINGRSKTYVNNIPVTLGILKELGEMLLDIHTQHSSIALLKPENQRLLLDEFAGISDEVITLGKYHQEIRVLNSTLAEAQASSQGLLLKQELLIEKIQDASELNLQENEWETLQSQQKQLANASLILQELDFALNLLTGEENSITNMSAILSSRINKISDYLPNFEQIHQLVTSLEAEANELNHELQSLANKVEQDPELLASVDSRIDAIYTLARKYRILPEEILAKISEWQSELDSLNHATDLNLIQEELKIAKANYSSLAKQISETRQQSATHLSNKVQELLKQLAISGQFKIDVQTNKEENSYGIDIIQYMVCFNQGMNLQPLNKVASGGELSRVALALYVTLSINNPPEVIIFDEIDVGIGGRVAEVVGRLLKELGKSKQIICITHQAQTACRGDFHLQVEKMVHESKTQSQLNYLYEEDRVNEIARMLGGLNITATTLQHAKEMLEAH